MTRESELSDSFTAFSEAVLDRLESEVDDNVDPEKLFAELDSLLAELPKDSCHRPRALRLMGVVNNRREERNSALGSLGEARALAFEQGNYSEMGAIAREAAVVYAWGGDDREAARELLQALALACASGNRQALARALAEAIRTEVEGSRYQQAFILFHALEGSGLVDLPARQQRRAKVTYCQVLNRLSRHEEALVQVEALKGEVPSADSCLRFLTLLEETRALAGIGRSDQAQISLGRAKEMLAARDDRFRRHEYREAEGELQLRRRDYSAAVETLDEVAQEFVDQGLTARAANVQLKLAQALFKTENADEAKAVLSSALRNAVSADLSELADRIRSEMIESEGGKHIEDLTTDIETIGGGSGLHRCFVLRKQIGQGGFSEVYRAIDLRDGREVALKKIDLVKVCSAERRRQLIASVKNEYGVTVNFTDARVARVRELLLKPNGTMFIVQDYIVGPNLRKLYGDHASRSQLLRLIADICGGLAALHAKHIVHRDLKPENIIVRDGTFPVLIDFGIALTLGHNDALPRHGSADYVAPEQVRGSDVDHRADIYSLGKMIAEIWGIKGSRDFGLMYLANWVSVPRRIRRLVRQMLKSDPEIRLCDLELIETTLRRQAQRTERRMR